MALTLPSLGRLFSGAGQSLWRFPLPVAAALLFTAIALADSHDLREIASDNHLQRLMVILPLIFFAALAAALFAEAHLWPSWAGHLLGGLAAIALLVLAFAGPGRPIWEFWAFHWPSFAGPTGTLSA